MDKPQNLKTSLIDDDNIQIKKKVKVVPIEKKNSNKAIETNNKIYDNFKRSNSNTIEDLKESNNTILNYIPIILFINKKSGSKEGEYILALKPKDVIKT